LSRRNFTVELRPRRLSEIRGQNALVNNIRDAFSTGSVPIVILLSGSYGQGKTTIARILGLSFNCQHQTTFGEPCDECLANEDMFNIIERNCAELTTKEEMTDFLPSLRSYPNFGKYRIVILDEMQQVSDKGQQVLLKPTEDKDSVNIFIICTSDPTKINKGLKDRARPFSVPELTPDGVIEVVENTMALAEDRFQILPRDPESLIQVLHSAQMTSARNVVMAVEQYLAGMSPEQAIVIKEAGDLNYYAIFNHISFGQWDEARALLQKAKPTEGVELKTRLSGHFRNILLKTPAGSRADLLALFIRELADNNIDEYGLQLSATVATCYRICQMVNEAKKRKPTLVA
jgi:DNA polymerase III gamma/tau subunit